MLAYRNFTSTAGAEKTIVAGHVDVHQHKVRPDNRKQLERASAVLGFGADFEAVDQLAHEYGFTDLNGSQPDIWRHIQEVRGTGLGADLNHYC
jgi:hypothetical protein